MPPLYPDRYNFMDNSFGNSDLSGNGFGTFVQFTTGDPGYDPDNVANESTVTTRQSWTVGGDWTFDTASGRLYYDLELAWTATGTATFTHFMIDDLGSPNDFRGRYQLPIPVNVSSGDVIRFPPNRLYFECDGLFANFRASPFLNFLVSETTFLGDFWGGTFTFRYFSLSTTTPNRDGTNFTEPPGTWTRDSQQAPAETIESPEIIKKYNASTISFPTATVQYTATHWGVFDSSTGGNLVYYGELDTPATVLVGQTPRFFADNWQIRSYRD